MYDPMRIAYLLANFPSLTESFALREIKALQRAGIDIDVLAAQKAPCQNCNYQVPIHYRPLRVSWKSLICIIKIGLLRPVRFTRLLIFAFRLLFVNSADFFSLMANIHAICSYSLYLQKKNIKHLHAYFFSWPLLIAIGIKIVSGVRISASAHSRDIYVEAGDVNYKIRAAEFVTVCTMTGIENLKTQVPKSLHPKLVLSYHGLDLNDVQPCRVKSDSFEIVAVGRLVPKKGFFVLLDAFKLIHKCYPDITLKIIGSGKLDCQITQYLKEHQLESSVSLTGWQDHDRVMDALSKASLLVSSSIKADDGDMDGIPNVILEAFSTMTPVIASDIEPVCEVIDHGINGYLFKAGDSNDLAEKIKDLYESNSKRDRLRLNAMDVLVWDFNIDKNVVDKIKLFEQSQ